MRGADAELAGAAARGMVWTLLATAAAKLSWLAALTVLARKLAPEDFGLFAFGLVFLTYAETLADLGTGAALIYWPREAEKVAQLTFFGNLALGGLWFGLTQVAAPWVAAFFGNPAGEPVLRLLAVSFLLRALGNTHDALSLKHMRFRARMVPELGLAAGKALAAVALALSGWGVWSLVLGQLLGEALWCGGLWAVVPWRPRLALPWGLAAPLLRYGRGIVAVNLLAAVVHHADLVVVGRMLGTAALGFYQMAAKLPEMTVTLVVWMAGRVLFPAFSRLQASGRDLGSGYLAALSWVSLLTLPAAAGLALVAEPLVLLLFGEEWRPAVPILRALAVYAGLRSLGSQAGDVLKACGRPGLLAGLGLAKAAVLVPVLVSAGRQSAVAVAVALAAVTAATALLNLVVVSRAVGISLGRLASALANSAAATGLLVLTLLAWQLLAPAANPGLDLSVQVAVGLAAYLAAVRLLDPGALGRAVRILRGGAGAGAEPGGALPRALER